MDGKVATIIPIDVFKRMSESPIVYLFMDRDRCLYAGASRLGWSRPLDSDHTYAHVRNEATHLEIIFFDRWEAALLAERCLIAEYAPKYNKLLTTGRWNKDDIQKRVVAAVSERKLDGVVSLRDFDAEFLQVNRHADAGGGRRGRPMRADIDSDGLADMYRSGYTLKQIAKKYGINATSVHYRLAKMGLINMYPSDLTTRHGKAQKYLPFAS